MLKTDCFVNKRAKRRNASVIIYRSPKECRGLAGVELLETASRCAAQPYAKVP